MELELDIQPLEELTVTEEVVHEKVGRYEVDTVITRRKGLHWLTQPSGTRVQADESVTMDGGPKLGTTLCLTPHMGGEADERERMANREYLKKCAAKVMTDMGIW